MIRPELAHLELLADLDSLSESIRKWVGEPPDWAVARACRSIVHRLSQRLDALRLRLQAPLIVATLGGTGVGKSALVNALVGEEVVETGRARPTTLQPTLICHPDISPEMLGIDPKSVAVIHKDSPALASLVLLDCPDPDTTESAEAAGTNLARLRQALPHCDVLLVASTQQKYRSARVADELAAAAAGARLVFVQTHADRDQDIRDDWRKVLEPRYASGRIFWVDSLAALADAQGGLEPRGEFAGLVDLLTRQLAGAAAARIRRANFLDLIDEALALCRQRIDQGTATVRTLEDALQEHRARLAAQLASGMHDELLANRRSWEQRLLGQVASQWGFSPFALVIRVFQGLGGLFSGALLYRARTPAQVALWGVFEGARSWQRFRQSRNTAAAAARTTLACWDQSELRSSALVIEGYASEAGLDRKKASPDTVLAEAAAAGEGFVAAISVELDALLARVASRHTGPLTRWRYEAIFLILLAAILCRPAKNFFYDSWLAPTPLPILGLDFYILSAFWLILGCVVLLWSFSGRLRRGLRAEMDHTAEGWGRPQLLEGVFAALEGEVRRVEQFHHELDHLDQEVARLRRRLSEPDDPLGHRR